MKVQVSHPWKHPSLCFCAEHHYFEGESLLNRAGDTNTVVDGFLSGVRRQGQTVVPLIWAKAPSGGQPTLETHNHLKNLLLERLTQQLPVDGVLLSLHGSYSVQGIMDADGDITKAVRGDRRSRLSDHHGPRHALQHRTGHG